MSARLIRGDCVEVMREMPDESVDAIVTDPPYGLSPDGKARTWDDVEDGRRGGGFMGKAWDAAVPGVTWARECLRVLSPGGHLVAFGGTRTVHRLTCAIEDAEFEIRDMGLWLYWSGFPKSLDVSKAIDAAAGATREVVGPDPEAARRNRKTPQFGGPSMNTYDPGYDGPLGRMAITAPATPEAAAWSGFGTALKPAHEPWILARKPLIGTVAANVLAHGTGALNVDACRYAYGDPAWPGPQDEPNVPQSDPANRSGVVGKAMQATGNAAKNHAAQAESIERLKRLGRWPANVYACPKASRSEREQGCEGLEALDAFQATGRDPGSAGMNSPRAGIRAGAVGRRTAEEADPIRNVHPTVKPLRLMRWLSRLVGGKPGSVILDPFMGSGTTGCAALIEGFNFIGIEREPDYLRIAEARIRHAARELGGGDTVDLFRRVPSVVVEGLDP